MHLMGKTEPWDPFPPTRHLATRRTATQQTKPSASQHSGSPSPG
jgi:hypothetical protein